MPRCGGLRELVGAVGLLGDVEIYGVIIRKVRLVFGGETTLPEIRSSGSPPSEFHILLHINIIYTPGPACSSRHIQNRIIHPRQLKYTTAGGL